MRRKRKRRDSTASSMTSPALAGPLDAGLQQAWPRSALAPSAAWRSTGDARVLARYGIGPPTGWIFEDGDGSPLAWLEQFDRHSWVANACTGDEIWTMAPRGKHRPDLVAEDHSGHIVARSQRPMMRAPRVLIATDRLRLHGPSFRDPDWTLRGQDGEPIACVTVTGKGAGTETLRLEWQRTTALPALLTLFCAYIIVIERATDAVGFGPS